MSRYIKPVTEVISLASGEKLMWTLGNSGDHGWMMPMQRNPNLPPQE